jgi:hypothetical protein
MPPVGWPASPSLRFEPWVNGPQCSSGSHWSSGMKGRKAWTEAIHSVSCRSRAATLCMLNRQHPEPHHSHTGVGVCGGCWYVWGVQCPGVRVQIRDALLAVPGASEQGLSARGTARCCGTGGEFQTLAPRQWYIRCDY